MNTINITRYETDIVAWAREQAALIRAGRFEHLDLEHIAEEIEDVGKSETRELASRMAVLLMHLLKWQYQPQFQHSTSWARTMRDQRKAIVKRLRNTPSLKPFLDDPEWVEDVWIDAVHDATKETKLDINTFPEVCPWTMEEVLQEGWLPA